MNNKMKQLSCCVIGIALMAFVMVVGCKTSGGEPPVTYTVTFDKNHDDAKAGTGWDNEFFTTKTVTSPATTVETLPAEPTRDGDWEFYGWDTQKDGNGLEFTAATEVTEDITVYAVWKSTIPGYIAVNLNVSGKDGADAITISSEGGSAGTEITINYTLANTAFENTLSFTGAAIDQITATGTGTTKYTINNADAVNGTITINAVFEHNYKVTLSPSGLDTTDAISISPEKGINGAPITITYALAKIGAINKITFTGTTPAIDPIAESGQGTTEYLINKADAAADGTITINAKFEHSYKVELTISGKTGTDNISISPEEGPADTKITISYTLANDKANNRLSFSGTSVLIDPITTATESGTKEYTIKGDDATDGTIIINALFEHSDKTLDAIAFADNQNENKIYGDAPFTKAIINTGSGSGAISYSSSNTSVATVNNSGQVTILKVGETTITARKAEDSTYAGAEAVYTLFVTHRQLTIANPNLTTTKTYDRTTTATVIAGTVSGVVSGETVTVSAVANYNNASVGNGKTITVVYTISGASAGNYNKPENYQVTNGVINALQLTIANPNLTTTKTYNDNTTATVTAGALSGVISPDTVTVSAAANYDNANAGTGKTITVAYTLAGASAGNYIKPVDYKVTNGIINRATGSALTANPSATATTTTSITLNTISLSTSTGQTVEYARNSDATTPTTGWQDGRDFTGLTADTNYYFFARSKENTNYNAGTARNAQIKTQAAGGGTPLPVPTTYTIDFEDATGPWTTGYVNGDGTPTVGIVTDPGNSGQKSLSIAATGFNQGATVRIKLPYALKNYKTISFRHNLTAGTVSGNISVYVAGATSAFRQYGFGNPAGGSNPDFASYLAGEKGVDLAAGDRNKWTTYTIDLASETAMGSDIRDLAGNIYLAIGINSNQSITHLFDDITFTLRDGKENTLDPPPAPLPTTGPTVPSVGAVESGIYRNMYVEMGKSATEVTAKMNSLWTRFFEGNAQQKFFHDDGSNANGAKAYIMDTGGFNGQLSNPDARTEGMSYGMMMAVQLNKKTEFKKLWNWAMSHMYHSDMTNKDIGGFFAWSVNPTNYNKNDPAPAPDGEFYFVTALLFAEARWGNEATGQDIYNYGYWARRILHDMLHRPVQYGNQYGAPLFNQEHKLPIFSPIGNAATYTDASYHLPAFFDVWAMAANDDSRYWTATDVKVWDDKAQADAAAQFYAEAATASRNFLHNATHNVTGLNPERSPFQPNNGSSSESGDKSQFEYDAWRVAMNIAVDQHWWNKDRDWQTGFANRILDFFHGKGVTTYGDRWKVNGDIVLDNQGKPVSDHSPGLVACNAAATLASTNVNAWEFLEDFWNVPMTEGTYRYYNGCLSMLAMLNLTGNFKNYYNGAGTPGVPNSSISPSSVEFSKQAPANIAITMNLNGNTLTSITNGAATLTSTGGTPNYSVSGTGDTRTVTLNTSYLNTLAVGTATLTFNFSQGSARTLTITVTNNIPNSTITPTTAQFNKNSTSPNNKSIAVTMSLNGNTLSSITNGGTTLTSGASGNYTVNDSTVTINLSYLNTLAVGTRTLTFNFSQGNTQTLTITVTDSAPSSVVAGFSASGADALASGAVAANIADMSEATATFSAAGSASTASINASGNLQINIGANNQNAVAIIPLNLGTGSLANYTKIRIEIAGITGDISYKRLTVEVPSTAGGTLANHGSNTEIVSQGNAINNTTWYTHTVNLSGSSAYSGSVSIGLWLENYNTATSYEIRAIYLVP